MSTKGYNKLLCVIHTHPKYKVIKQAKSWEDWLYIRYGVTSSAELDNEELREVLDIFNGKIPDRNYIRRTNFANTTQRITPAQQSKIDALLRDLGWEQGRYFAFIKHQLGDFMLPHSLNKAQATKVITGLQKIVGER